MLVTPASSRHRVRMIGGSSTTKTTTRKRNTHVLSSQEIMEQEEEEKKKKNIFSSTNKQEDDQPNQEQDYDQDAEDRFFPDSKEAGEIGDQKGLDGCYFNFITPHVTRQRNALLTIPWRYLNATRCENQVTTIAVGNYERHRSDYEYVHMFHKIVNGLITQFRRGTQDIFKKLNVQRGKGKDGTFPTIFFQCILYSD